MKRLVILTSLFICSQFVIGQSQKYTFEQIGFIFTPPVGYSLIDSSINTESPTEDIKYWRKQFMFFKDGNYLMLSISTSTQKGIDWNNIFKKEAKHFFNQISIQKPSLSFDTSSTIMSIDSQVFNKFTITGKENGQVSYNHIQLANYMNGYKINIAYNFKSEENAIEIENALRVSKFSH
jgi:hypothetical protein